MWTLICLRLYGINYRNKIQLIFILYFFLQAISTALFCWITLCWQFTNNREWSHLRRACRYQHLNSHGRLFLLRHTKAHRPGLPPFLMKLKNTASWIERLFWFAMSFEMSQSMKGEVAHTCYYTPLAQRHRNGGFLLFISSFLTPS